MTRIPIAVSSVLLVPLLGAALPASAGIAACGAFPEGALVHQCLCEPGPQHGGAVWGSGPYTADSDLCVAAFHAGAIGAAGGPMIAIATLPPPSYRGSLSNGVQTSDFGAYDRAIVIYGAAQGVGSVACGRLPEGVAAYGCTCPSLADAGGTGSVWGSGPYTADSDICTAARHAGLIGDAGGEVSVVERPGLDAYPGSTAHGVTTSAWGAYGRSFEFRP